MEIRAADLESQSNLMMNTAERGVGEVVLSSTGEFIWKIKVKDWDSKNLGDSITSPTFGVKLGSKHHLWSLDIYPNGHNLYKESICFFLSKFFAEDLEALKMEVSFVNVNNYKILTKKTLPFFFSKDKSEFKALGDILCNVSNFKVLRRRIIKDNILTISCKIITSNDCSLKNILDEENIIKLKLFNRFENFMDKKELSDVSLIVDDKKFYANKCILAAQSPVFEAMFQHDMQEKNKNIVQIDHIKSNVFEEFIRFVYTGKVSKIKTIVCDLLTVAEKYNVKELKVTCEQVMCDSITENNVLEYLNCAVMNNAFNFKLRAVNYIASNAKNFLQKPKFNSFLLENPEIMLQVMKITMNVTNFSQGSVDEEIKEESEEPSKKKKKFNHK